MSIRHFSKMHGLGNDFIVLNALQQTFDWPRARISALADRIFNADGGEVEHCGNGARCFGKYLRDHSLHPLDRPLRVAVKRGSITIAYVGAGEDGSEQYRVDMGEPDFTPFTAAQTERLYQPVSAAGHELQMGIVSMGNPHTVCVVEDVASAPRFNNTRFSPPPSMPASCKSATAPTSACAFLSAARARRKPAAPGRVRR